MLGNRLCPQMFFDGQRVIGAAFYCRIVADDHALAARHASDARNQACAGNFILIQTKSRELPNFKERAAWIEQGFHAVAGEQLAA